MIIYSHPRGSVYSIQTGVWLPQTKCLWPIGGQCGHLCSIRSPSMHLTGPFTTCTIKSQPTKRDKFSNEFPNQAFQIDRRAPICNQQPSTPSFLTRFRLFRCTMRRSARRCEWTNALIRPEKKTNTRLGLCMQMRTSEGALEFRVGRRFDVPFRNAAKERVAARYTSPDVLFDFL